MIKRDWRTRVEPADAVVSRSGSDRDADHFAVRQRSPSLEQSAQRLKKKSNLFLPPHPRSRLTCVVFAAATTIASSSDNGQTVESWLFGCSFFFFLIGGPYSIFKTSYSSKACVVQTFAQRLGCFVCVRVCVRVS